MTNNEIYELTIWEGDYGLPSVDINSLMVYAYLTCLKKDCVVKYCTNPLFNSLPRLCIRSENSQKKIQIENFTNKWMSRQMKDIPDLDYDLTPLQQTESRIYYMYLKENFLPCLWDTLWLNEQNYMELTRRWYRSAMPFPFNLIYPWWKRSSIVKYVESLMINDNVEEFSTMLLNKAKICLDNISSKLLEQNYFLGTDKPCTIDVIIYSHLAALMLAPLPASPLQIYAKNQNNLVKHVERMSQLFPNVKVKYKYVEKNVEQETELKSSPGTLIMAILVAATTMIGYGMVIGVIKPSRI